MEGEFGPLALQPALCLDQHRFDHLVGVVEGGHDPAEDVDLLETGIAADQAVVGLIAPTQGHADGQQRYGSPRLGPQGGHGDTADRHIEHDEARHFEGEGLHP